MTVRDRRVIVVIVALALLIGAWLIVIAPKRGQASKLGNELSAAQSQLNSTRSQALQDEAARHSFAGDYTSLARLGEAVPADDNVPSLLYELQSAASATHVDFRNLVLDPGAGGGAAPAAAPAPAATPANGSSSSSSPASSSSSSSTPASSTSAIAPSAATLPPGAAVGPAGFPTEEFTLTFQGNFFHLANFFKRLEAFVRVTNKRVAVSGRLMTLNAINLGAATSGFPQMDATISATTYLVPAAQGVLDGASPGGPQSTASAASTSKASSSTPVATVTPSVP